MIAQIGTGIEMSRECYHRSATGLPVSDCLRWLGGANHRKFGLTHFAVIGAALILKWQSIRVRCR